MGIDMTLLRRYKDELGYYPATTDPEDIECHRHLNRALDKAPTGEHLRKRYAHLHTAPSAAS